MTPVQVVLLVAGILLVNVLLIGLAFSWIRKRKDAVVDALRAEIAAKKDLTVVLGPVLGAYQGATGGQFTRVRGMAVLAVTTDAILVRRLVGDPFDVPLATLRGVREDKWFDGGYRSGRLHLIVQLEGAEVALMVEEHAAWMEALRARATE